MPPETLRSERFGGLYALEDTDYPVYRSDDLQACGLSLTVDVHCPSSLGGDAVALLTEVERRLDTLFALEPLVRPAIAARALTDMKSYWLDARVPDPQSLLADLELETANCFPDGRYECWYALPEPVDDFDLTAEFGEDRTIFAVHFDG